MTFAPAGAFRFSPTSTILPASHTTSARKLRSALTTVPPRMNTAMMWPSFCSVVRLILMKIFQHEDAKTRRNAKGRKNGCSHDEKCQHGCSSTFAFVYICFLRVFVPLKGVLK